MSQGAWESVDSSGMFSTLGMFSTQNAMGFQRITSSFQKNPFPIPSKNHSDGYQHWLLAWVLTGPESASGQGMLRTFLPSPTPTDRAMSQNTDSSQLVAVSHVI